MPFCLANYLLASALRRWENSAGPEGRTLFDSCGLAMPEKIECSAIQEQVNKILGSAALASKPQVRKLLQILARSADGKLALNSTRIIQELWPAETQTKGPLDVAKEVSRLRAALESYYAGEGRSDSVVIVLPNRSKPRPDGTPEKRWIAVLPQDDAAPTNRPESRRISPVLIAAAAIIAVVFAGYFLFEMLGGDRRPALARFDDTTLTVSNAAGKTLWRRNFADGSWGRFRELIPKPWVGNLDADGHASILFAYHTARDADTKSTVLICYSERGEEKWRWTSGRNVPELEGSPIGFTISSVSVFPPDHGGASRIVVASWHNLYYPSQIALLDSKGKTISEYWHSGHLEHVALADLDGDGKQKIIATGVSNGYHQATLVVLDPDHLAGASAETARPEIQIHGMGMAHERLRLLFPRSDLNRDRSAYNWALMPLIEHGRITLAVKEDLNDPACAISYEFDTKFHLLGVEAYDNFASAHNEFYRNGSGRHSFTQREEAEFQKVRCLTGCDGEYVAFSGGHAP